MANQEALIAEYSALRQEISGAQQKRLQFIGAASAVGAAFVVYGFQAQYSLAFLAAFFVLLVTMYYFTVSTRHLVFVGTYLYAIVEPKLEGLQWETMLAERRTRELRFSFRLDYPKRKNQKCNNAKSRNSNSSNSTKYKIENEIEKIKITA